jgi:hypothetical protein
MSFRLNINESNKKAFVQQQNYVDVSNDTIKIRSAFSENGVYEFYFTGNIVEFTVPISGTYKIEAWGARGGGGNNIGPLGAYSKSFVLLNKDEKIKILVGEKGYPGCDSGNCIYCGGGGGGTFIAKDRTPLCVAGGGGSLDYSAYSTIQSHACGQATQLSANFGTGQATLRMGGVATISSGGGGFEGNGESGTKYGNGGNSFFSGGARQTSGTICGSYGGFGGGASNNGRCGRGVGGGGYTGGCSSVNNNNDGSTQGGGGGSYFEGFYNNEVSEAISGCNESLPTNPDTNENGFALLTLLTGTSPGTFNKKVSCVYYRGHISWVFFAAFISQ